MPYGASAGGAEREDCLVLNDQSRLVNDPAADERLLWESVSTLNVASPLYGEKL